MGCHGQNKVRRMSLPHRGATQCKTLKPEQSEEDVLIEGGGGEVGTGLEPQWGEEVAQTEGRGGVKWQGLSWVKKDIHMEPKWYKEDR